MPNLTCPNQLLMHLHQTLQVSEGSMDASKEAMLCDLTK
jgi:hypothetical protein